MAFLTYIYNSFVHINEPISKDRNTKFNILIYIISMFCSVISITLISSTRTSIIVIVFLTIFAAFYFAVVNIINASLVHFISSFFYKYRAKQSVRTFFIDMFGIYKVFIALLPISLLLSILPSTAYKVFFVLAFILLFAYYMYNFARVIYANIDMPSSSYAAIILLIVYIVPGVVNFIFNISYVVLVFKLLSVLFS